MGSDRTLLFRCVHVHLWRVESEAKESSRRLTWSTSRVILIGYERFHTFGALATAEKHPAGNLRQLMREQVGHYDVNLQDNYGMIARIKAPFGVRRFLLLLSGATALLRSRTG